MLIIRSRQRPRYSIATLREGLVTGLAAGAALLLLTISGAAANPSVPGSPPAGSRQGDAATITAVVPQGTEQPTQPSSKNPAHVLGDQDEELYRRIFALQSEGRWKDADQLIEKLDDRRLMGHVLEQRYMHPTAYRSRYKELLFWLDDYADHPDATRIYRLAVKRRPANYRHPKKPEVPARVISGSGPTGYNYKSDKSRTAAERRRVAQIKRQIRRNVLRTYLSATERLLKTPEVRHLFDQVEIDEGYTKVAAAWFYYGDSQRAYDLARMASNRSGQFIPEAPWIAGLAAWRLGKVESAAKQFEALALSENASDWIATSGAYWAARAHLKLKNPGAMSRWLTLAAEHPRTFYGLLAARALGVPPNLNFDARELDEAMVARLESSPVGARALALLQVGQRTRAEQELMRFSQWDEPQAAQALLTLANQARMPSLAYKLGSRLHYGGRAARPKISEQMAAQANGQGFGNDLDMALYPLPPWRPQSGFKVDRALIFALMRQESKFNIKAKSVDGARGLMQLMPRTATYISRTSRYTGKRRDELYDPRLNMELGQRYVNYLLNMDHIDGDLFRLATAYNGGPGNLGKWERHVNVSDDDPLLFIESLPSRETRLFIERVLANLWIYRLRLDQPAPSLDSIAAGKWPRYVRLDGVLRPEVAQKESD
ncbi:MAG: lytic transglycosylase domain-containing protein [Pseudomonadota bacterium]